MSELYPAQGWGPVEGIAPVDGWTLWSWPEHGHAAFHAVQGECRVALGVSRFRFTPTQARFEWLVRSNFPLMIERDAGCVGPLTDSHIDGAIAAAAMREAA